MKRLSILAGLAMLIFATPSQAAEEKTCDAWINGRYVPCALQQGSQGTPQGTPQQTGWEPPANSGVERCGYGGGQNCWQAPDGSWWKGPKPTDWGGGQQGTGQPGTWQPGQEQAHNCPPNSIWNPQQNRCLFQKTTTPEKKCPPGTVALLYGSKWICKRQGTNTAQQCQQGWIWSPRRGQCVPGTVGGGTDGQQGHRCGYGKVWSDQYGRCVRFGGGTDGGQQQAGYGCKPWERWSNRQQSCVPKRQGGGTYGDQGGWQQGSQGGYGCGPYERWSNSRQTCVPRRGGGGDTYGSGGSTYGGSQGIPGINIYIGGGKKKRGGDDYGNRGGGGDYGNRGGGGDYGYRGSGGNDYRGRGR